jgi:MFS family permease
MAHRRGFAALAHAAFPGFLVGNTVAMLADNTEHVISYWMMHQRFHSPALGAFAVIAHWVPYLLFAGVSGMLAARLGARGMIATGMLLFMAVSLGWGWMFLGGWFSPALACVLLVGHGMAGVLWTPPSQLMLYGLVGPEDLQSAVRLNASGRSLGMLAGPAVGNLFMVTLGPALGILVNALVYLPMLWWLWRTRPRTGHAGALRAAGAVAAQAHPPARPPARPSLASAWRSIVAHPALLAMTLLGGGASFLVGNAYQAQMPGFAEDLGTGRAGAAYAALLGADAAGAVCAVLLLESRNLLPAAPRTALVLAGAWSLSLCGFALSHSYPLCIALLFLAGFFELSFVSMNQTIVQLESGAAERGAVIGLYATATMGLRAFSGITVGLGGALLDIHRSLALSTAAVFCLVLAIAWSLARARGGGVRRP